MVRDDGRTVEGAQVDGVGWITIPDSDDIHSGQLVVPKDDALRQWMLSWSHDSVEGGHRGGERMYEWLRSRVWWSGMQEDAQKYARGCEECQRSKPDQRGRQGLP